MKKYSLLYLLVFVLSVACSNSKNSSGDVVVESRIVGYAGGKGSLGVTNEAAAKLTHINYAFANIVDNKPKFMSDEDSVNLAYLTSLKKVNPDLKILYSIGGWGWSTYFSNVAVSDESRKIFAEESIALMQKHKLDGVDLDWEYPAQRGPHNVYRPMDKRTFTLLLEEIREQLEALTKETGKHYLLTIASAADQTYIDNTELGIAHEYLDFINVMTYDLYHGYHYQTGHHSNLFPSDKEEFGGNSSLEAINRHVDAGVPINKLVLGVPFYGRIWKGVKKHNNGLYQPAETSGGGINYNDIVPLLDDNEYMQKWDSSAKAPYLWNHVSGIFISYENPESLKEKLKFVNEKQLGGVMYWEHSLDTSLVLLNTIVEGLSK